MAGRTKRGEPAWDGDGPEPPVALSLTASEVARPVHALDRAMVAERAGPWRHFVVLPALRAVRGDLLEERRAAVTARTGGER